MKLSGLLLSFSFVAASFAQTDLEKVRAYRTKNESNIYNEFVSFLQIPNVATDTANVRKNADFLVRTMKAKGINNVRLLEAGDALVPPVVYGEAATPGVAQTVVFYAHYDGQPVNAAVWAKDLHPFRPQLLNGRSDEGATVQQSAFPLNDDGRIYARGASDDKGGVMAILNAFDAIKASGLTLPYNVKFFFEGEEEQGSPHLARILQKNKALLGSTLWIICDGPVHQSGRKQVVFGARGDAHLTLTIYGPKNPLHSGHYGNWVPNPVMALAKLLASLKDDDGRVAVNGFYDDVVPLSATETKALAAVPDVETDLKRKLGFAAEDMKGKSLNEAVNLPSLNVNGIESSNVGTIQANVIPVSATAVIDLRLVLGNDWKRQQQKVIDHIVSQGYYVTDTGPTDEERGKYPKIVQVKRGAGNNAQRTSMDWPPAQKIVAAVQRTTPETVLQIPTLGGSLPVDDLVAILNAPFLIVPIANHDNNQHAENENIRVRNLRDGIDIMASIMLMK